MQPDGVRGETYANPPRTCLNDDYVVTPRVVEARHQRQARDRRSGEAEPTEAAPFAIEQAQ